MDLELIKLHLQRARTQSRNSFEEYDALWAAFNVFYEGTRTELIMEIHRSVSEREMIKYCVKKLDYRDWNQLFKQGKLDSLIAIAPIFNERDWLRYAKINTREFDRLVINTKRGLSGTAEKDKDLIESLVDLLYVVRCNRHHGFKTPARKRDREVLDAAVPILREIVMKLAFHFGIK